MLRPFRIAIVFEPIEKLLIPNDCYVRYGRNKGGFFWIVILEFLPK
jgi:hypothetical protein